MCYHTCLHIYLWLYVNANSICSVGCAPFRTIPDCSTNEISEAAIREPHFSLVESLMPRSIFPAKCIWNINKAVRGPLKGLLVHGGEHNKNI